jgi:Protein of unknown function (DUF2510)
VARGTGSIAAGCLTLFAGGFGLFVFDGVHNACYTSLGVLAQSVSQQTIHKCGAVSVGWVVSVLAVVFGGVFLLGGIIQRALSELAPQRDAVPAGWYPDDKPGRERFWNGRKWTGRSRPVAG